MWKLVDETLLLTNFFPIVDTCLSCEDIARQSCAKVMLNSNTSSTCPYYQYGEVRPTSG